jgi:hypothetical protein
MARYIYPSLRTVASAIKRAQEKIVGDLNLSVSVYGACDGRADWSLDCSARPSHWRTISGLRWGSMKVPANATRAQVQRIAFALLAQAKRVNRS